MRREPFGVGSYVHVIKRGARGIDIVRDDSDRWRFIRLLFHMNDEHFEPNWITVTKGKSLFVRPKSLPVRKALVDIECFTLMPNHFHLLLREISDGGTSRFMQKIGQSMSEHANKKYKERGSLFQGAYRSKTIDTDTYLRYVSVYVMVKNTFELYPLGGLKEAQKNFEDAWSWALSYPFSSLGYFGGIDQKSSAVISKRILKELFEGPGDFKRFAQEVIESGKWGEVMFE